MKKLALIFLIILSSNLYAKNTILYMGAGGEDANKDDTIFDEGAELFGKFYNRVKNNYQTSVAFNGGHDKTTQIISKGFKGASIEQSFDRETYDRLIDDLKNKLSKNPPDIKPGEKIMIFIDTHGAEKSSGELAHSVSLSGSGIKDYNSGSSGETSLDLSTLKELTELAEKKRVNLAIIDGSCHSGNTLALANSKTCVISGSLPNQFATDFTNYMANKMKPGISLEDAYLQARKEADGVPFPMISTAAGNKVQNDLKGIVPYLFYHEKVDNTFSLDKIDQYFVNSAAEVNDCRRNRDIDELYRMLDFIKNFNRQLKRKSKINLEALKSKIREFKKVQDDYILKLRDTQISDSYIKEKITVEAEGLKQTLSRKDLIASDYSKMIEDKKSDIKKTNDQTAINHMNRYLKFYEKLNEAKKNIESNPKIGTYKNLMDSIKNDQRLIPDSFASIGEEMRAVYDEYYQQVSLSTKSLPNPCAEFKI